MKIITKKTAVVALGFILGLTMLSSCHHNTCPTFGNAETPQFEECA